MSGGSECLMSSLRDSPAFLMFYLSLLYGYLLCQIIGWMVLFLLFSLGNHTRSYVFPYHIHSSNSQTSISPPNSTILSANHQLDISTGLFHEISESSCYHFFSNLLLFLCSLSQIMGPSSVKGWSQKFGQYAHVIPLPYPIKDSNNNNNFIVMANIWMFTMFQILC